MSDEKKYCTECGEENPITNEFCTSCGHKFTIDKVEDKGAENDVVLNEPVTPADNLETAPTIDQKETPKIDQDNLKSDSSNSGNKIIQFLIANKLIAGIGAGMIVAVLAFVFFFAGSIEASGTWTTTDEEYYYNRERYSTDIKRNGNVEVFIEYADELSGTIALTFSIEEDDWESTDTRKAYGLNEMESLEIVVPNLTYQHERSEILSEFSRSGIDYDINEGRDDVTIIFDFSTHADELFGSDFETLLELVNENDSENEYGENYIVFYGFDGRKELFSR